MSRHTVRAMDSKGRFYFRGYNFAPFTHCLVIYYKNTSYDTVWSRSKTPLQVAAAHALKNVHVAKVEICAASKFTSLEAGREYAKVLDAMRRGEAYEPEKPLPKVRVVK
jgi:hypothetical protein